MAQETAVAKKPSMVEEIALAKIQEYQSAGLVLPPNFNPANSLKKARFMLNEMKVNGKPVLEVCSQASIVQCLLDSVTDGLDFSLGQIYFIPRNGVMTTLESVYGRIARAKRASKNYKPIVQYVHEDDEFEFGVDTETGDTKIVKHNTNLANLDKPIIAAYTYVTDNDGHTDVFIMTKKEWLTSWKKSSNGAAVAKEFERDMVFRSLIKKATKSLVRSESNAHFTQRTEDDDAPLAGDTAPEVVDLPQTDYEDFTEAEEVVEETPTPAPDALKDAKPDNFDF